MLSSKEKWQKIKPAAFKKSQEDAALVMMNEKSGIQITETGSFR